MIFEQELGQLRLQSFLNRRLLQTRRGDQLRLGRLSTVCSSLALEQISLGAPLELGRLSGWFALKFARPGPANEDILDLTNTVVLTFQRLNSHRAVPYYIDRWLYKNVYLSLVVCIALTLDYAVRAKRFLYIILKVVILAFTLNMGLLACELAHLAFGGTLLPRRF